MLLYWAYIPQRSLLQKFSSIRSTRLIVDSIDYSSIKFPSLYSRTFTGVSTRTRIPSTRSWCSTTRAFRIPPPAVNSKTALHSTTSTTITFTNGCSYCSTTWIWIILGKDTTRSVKELSNDDIVHLLCENANRSIIVCSGTYRSWLGQRRRKLARADRESVRR